MHMPELDNWTYWCSRMTDAERRYIMSLCINGKELDDCLTQIRTQGGTRGPTRELTVYEEAGRFADTYRGEGWMRLRGILVEFYHHMRCNQLQKDEKKI